MSVDELTKNMTWEARSRDPSSNSILVRGMASLIAGSQASPVCKAHMSKLGCAIILNAGRIKTRDVARNLTRGPQGFIVKAPPADAKTRTAISSAGTRSFLVQV